jgi:arginyl-tRNA synthetase
MPTVAATLTALVREAALRAGLQPGDALEGCVPTKDSAHGDYQSNVAFRLAKIAGKPPPLVAAALRDHFPPNEVVADVQVAGPGFLNLRLTDGWLAADVLGRLADPRLGTPAVGEGRTLVLDYSSPNIAKRMHVGHLRSTLIGGAIDRIYRFLGWRVVADNHLGDWGTPYGKLMVAWQDHRDEAAYRADPIGELQRLYQGFDGHAAQDPALLDRARAETVKLQNREPASIALWQEFVDRTMAELRVVYGRLGCRFDTFLGESAYADALAPLIEELLASGVAEDSRGAVVIRFTEADGKGLSDQPMLIRKADGAALYGTTDLATVRHRMASWSPERIVYVVDTRQQLHFRQVFAAARRMGVPAVELVHLWFGMLKLPGGAIVASRTKAGAEVDEEAGSQSVNLVDVLDTAAAKAFEVVTEKNPDLAEAERRAIAEVVGVGTIKYFDLSQNPQSDITFSWEKALSLDGGSAVYLQYAYARLHSILRNGGADQRVPSVAPSVVHPTERWLALLVARTPEVVITAAEVYRPNLIAEHLETLAKGVGPFWEACPVLKEGVPAEVREARLSLVHAVATTLRTGLDLLGIGVVPRM